MNIFREIENSRSSNKKAVLCLIVLASGSTPRKMGTKMIVYEDGSIYGTIGGGNLEKKVIEDALEQIKLNEPKLFKHDLLKYNMCCGGSVGVYIEPIYKMNKLYIFGAGHTGAALAEYTSALDFDVYVFDDRREYLDNITNESITTKLTDYKDILPTLDFDDQTYVAIMTYEHNYDRDILAYCIEQPHAYLGMIGSQRKVAVTKRMFLEEGIAKRKDLDMVDMPMGLEIKAESPEEISISILAKIINVKNG
jgi:xanthine dehydrogenase accessory factor